MIRRRKLPAGRDSLSAFRCGADPWEALAGAGEALALTSENDLGTMYREGFALAQGLAKSVPQRGCAPFAGSLITASLKRPWLLGQGNREREAFSG